MERGRGGMLLDSILLGHVANAVDVLFPHHHPRFNGRFSAGVLSWAEGRSNDIPRVGRLDNILVFLADHIQF